MVELKKIRKKPVEVEAFELKKEMLKNTPVEEFVETFKAKVNEKYLFLEKANKLDNLKLLFEELKEGL